MNVEDFTLKANSLLVTESSVDKIGVSLQSFVVRNRETPETENGRFLPKSRLIEPQISYTKASKATVTIG